MNQLFQIETNDPIRALKGKQVVEKDVRGIDLNT